MSTTILPDLAPDLAQAQTFLNILDPRPGAAFGFRTIDDKDDDTRLAVKASGTLDRGVRQSANPAKNGKPCCPAGLLTYMQGLGAGVFVVPNELDGQGQHKRNVTRSRAGYLDCDSRREVEAARAFVARSGLAPSIIVASGGVHDGVDKLHLYWCLDGCPVADFTHLQLTLASRTGSDPAVQDAGRVMRLPGFWHQKRTPRMTRVVEASGARYAWPGFLARVQAQPQVCDPWAGGKGAGTRRASPGQPLDPAGPGARLRVLLDLHAGLVTPAVRALLREAKAPCDDGAGNRHATLLAVAARCVQVGWPDADIQALVQPVLVQHWGGDRRERLAEMLAWVRGQEAAAIAAAPPLTARAALLAAAIATPHGATE